MYASLASRARVLRPYFCPPAHTSYAVRISNFVGVDRSPQASERSQDGSAGSSVSRGSYSETFSHGRRLSEAGTRVPLHCITCAFPNPCSMRRVRRIFASCRATTDGGRPTEEKVPTLFVRCCPAKRRECEVEVGTVRMCPDVFC